MRRTRGLVLSLAAVLGLSASAPAGVFRNVVRGLEYAGFDFVGQENPLSGGADFQLSRTFNGETLDFGSTDLTLSGPIEFDFKTGGRGLETLDFSLNTRNQPLRYLLNADVGGQSTVIDGSMLLNATGNINSFGFYNLNLQYSVREKITQDGRFGNGDEFVDYDIGPVNVSGNIFADFLATMFDPLFQASGTDNIFASFSGRLQAEEELNRRVADARAQAVAGWSSSSAGGDGQSETASVFSASAVTLRDGAPAQNYGIPDPPTIMLLIAAVPLLGSMGRRRR